MIYKHAILIVLLLLELAIGTEIELTGKVRHANTYSLIPNVNIYIENTKFGSISDEDGVFSLYIIDPQNDMTVIFQHVAFDTLRLNIIDVIDNDDFYLQPRIIQVPEITVGAEFYIPDIVKDLPQPISIVTEKQFELRGYVDAGDLLNTEQSVQIDESLSGSKYISIRAGNPEDVIVLYNGIKMNNIYDNTFDLSLINLEDMKQVEIIKGSNTALYGSDAFSGVVNFIPKMSHAYNIRMSQRFGTYNSADWNLQLHYNIKNQFNISYNYKQGASKRKYIDNSDDNEYIDNKISYHTGNLSYLFKKNNEYTGDQIIANYINSRTSYNDQRYNESITNKNQVFSGRYLGSIFSVTGLNLVGSYQELEKEERFSVENFKLERYFNNTKSTIHLEKEFSLNTISILTAYQYENGSLNFSDRRYISSTPGAGIEDSKYQSYKHGFVGIFKLHTPTGADFMQIADVDLSYRYDLVKNNPEIETSQSIPAYSDLIGPTEWGNSTVKMASHISGIQASYYFDFFMNYGNNIKYPTLIQQLSTPASLILNEINEANLKPEKTRSLEIGFEVLRQTEDTHSLFGWKLSGSYFQTFYDNKFRIYKLPGLPINIYDNVPNAQISGLEGNVMAFFLKKKITLEYGISDYAISDKSAFPFKYDRKMIANLYIDHAGYSFQLHWFKESEQVGFIRDSGDDDNTFKGLILPGFQNIDIHFSKIFEIWKLRLFGNFTVRNLLNDDTQLEGIAIRDRRIYLTFGVEY